MLVGAFFFVVNKKQIFKFNELKFIMLLIQQDANAKVVEYVEEWPITAYMAT